MALKAAAVSVGSRVVVHSVLRFRVAIARENGHEGHADGGNVAVTAHLGHEAAAGSHYAADLASMAS